MKEFTEDQKNLSLEFNEFLKVAFASLVFDYECISLYIFQSHEQLSSNAGWSKLDFFQRDKCKPVILRLSLARNLEKSVMSLFWTGWRERGFRHRENNRSPTRPTLILTHKRNLSRQKESETFLTQ